MNKLGVVISVAVLAGCSSADNQGAFVPPADLAGITLPRATDPSFCQAMQKVLSQTEMDSVNTVFDSALDYVLSKTSIKPLRSYQYITVEGGMPMAVSCKIKGSAQIRAEYGEDKAGEQRFCPAATAIVVQQVAAELEARGNSEAAARARAFVIDNNQPVMGGPGYLAAFELSYADEAGNVHLASPGLFQNYDSWITPILPDDFTGPLYCHTASHAYVTALATEELQPGWVMDAEGAAEAEDPDA